MTDDKRFTIDEEGNITDTETDRTLYVENKYTECNYFFRLLNQLLEENEQLKEENKDLHKKEVELGQNYLRLLEENENLKKQLDYIQNSINEHIKHQKTELGQKALRKIIEDYNEWMLGHKELKK